MKKYLFLATLTLACLSTRCQQRVFELPLDSSRLSSMKAIPVYDPAGNTIQLTLISPHQLQHFAIAADDTSFHGPAEPLYDLTMEKTSRKSPVLPPPDKFLGATPLSDGIEEAYSVGLGIRFYHTKFHPRGNQNDHSHDAPPQQTDSIDVSRDQRLFAAFYQSGDCYVLGTTKGSDQITIWRHHPGGGTTMTIKTVPVKNWGKVGHHQKITQKIHIDDLNDLIEDIAMISRDPATYPPLVPTLGHSHLFVGNGRVYMTFDNTREETHVIDLPLDDRPVRILTIDPATWYQKEPPPGFSNENSFIFDSTLVVAAIVHLQFYLAFYDLTTGKLKTLYTPDQNGQTTFPHSPALQVGDFWKKDRIHRIPMAELYKNSFDYWTLGVTAGHFGDKMELQIGTVYDRETFGKFMLAFSSMAISAAGVIPGIVYIGPGSGSANIMYFKTHLTPDSLKPVSYPAFADKSQLIDTFAVAQKMARNGSFLLDYAGTYWYGYVDLWEEKYIICKF